MMTKATDAILAMVKQLRDMEDMEKMKTFNDRLQLVEVEADKHMNELLARPLRRQIRRHPRHRRP